MGETCDTARVTGASRCALAHSKAHAIAGFSLPTQHGVMDNTGGWSNHPFFHTRVAWPLAWVYIYNTQEPVPDEPSRRNCSVP